MLLYLLMSLLRTRGGRRILGILVIIVIAMTLFGRGCQMFAPSNSDTQVPYNPRRADTQQAPGSKSEGRYANADDDEIKDFLAVVLAGTEDTYDKLFKEMGKRYDPPTLVLYDDYIQSACGFSSAAVGPFYCPADKKVYIDTSFFRQLSHDYGASGDFAMAYVLAHEVGHHVQNLLGISGQVHRLQQRASEKEANRLSVRLELQADYLAGVWAHYADLADMLEDGDIDEALNAAHAIGDDRLQREGRGYVVPDSFTHGTSEQRARWFKKGYKYGTLEDGDTFSIDYESLFVH